MAHSGFPRIVNPDFSPPQDIMSYQEPFDKNLMGEDYTMNPDYSLSTFFDTESFFSRPLASTEASTSQGYQTGPIPQIFNSMLPPTGLAPLAVSPRQIVLRTPLGQIPSYQPTNPLELPFPKTIEPTGFSPTTYSTSRTPSLSGDFIAPPNITTAATTTHTSPDPIKAESPTTPTSPIAQTPTTTSSTSVTTSHPPRKRGRPRLSQSNSTSDRPPHSINSATSSKVPKTTPTSSLSTSRRLPHNQVERKYREGLNSELERLRRAVPSLAMQAAEEMTSTRPSKAMVLAGAIDYIKRLEGERDEARRQVDLLRADRGIERVGDLKGLDGGVDEDDGSGWLGE